jgi:hypothetical protein
VSNAGDFDSVLSALYKEDAVVATTQAESGERWSEFFHVAAARPNIPIQTMQDIEGYLAVDAAEVRTSK